MVLLATETVGNAPPPSHDHSFDLRLINIRDGKREVRLEAALDILIEGDLHIIDLYVVPLLSDRSVRVRKRIYRKLIDLTGVKHPAQIGFYHREMYWLRRKQ